MFPNFTHTGPVEKLASRLFPIVVLRTTERFYYRFAQANPRNSIKERISQQARTVSFGEKFRAQIWAARKHTTLEYEY